MQIALAHNDSYSETRAFHLHKLGGCNKNKAKQNTQKIECDYVKRNAIVILMNTEIRIRNTSSVYRVLSLG